MNSSYTKPLQILKASAGSGKTFSLTIRFLALLFSGENKYRRIMAVTFTNKATAEMKHRILSVLALLAKGDWNNSASYLNEIKTIYPELSNEQIQEKAKLIYRQILHDYGRLTITTIDKFVQQIIRSFTFELGIDSDYQVTLNLGKVAKDLSEMLHQSLNENPDLLEWIIERAKSRINEGKTWNYQKELESLSFQIFSENFQTFDEAIKERDNDTLFLETKNNIKKIRTEFEGNLKSLFLEANQIFTSNRQEQEVLKGKSRSPLLHLNKSFPAFFDYLLNSGTGILEKIVDDQNQWFSKEATESQTLLFYLLNPRLDQLVRHFNNGIESYNLAIAIEENLYYLRLMKEMSSLLKKYRVENHVLLISDATMLLEGITRGMEDNPSFIWEKAGNRYQHFLFDEFQDTSRNQWKNFKPLVKNALGAAEGKRTEHLIVGDVKQSIYRWRGGDWKILLREAEQSLGTPFVDVASLQTNYRSEAQIIEFNNYVFPFMSEWLQQHINTNVQEKTGNNFFQDYWHQNDYDTIIQEAYLDVKQQIPAGKNRNSGIVDWKVFEVSDNRHREKQLRDAVLKETADRLFRWIVEEKRYQPGQIGILVRKNNEAQTLLSYLKKDLQERGQPNAYSVISGDALKLNDHPGIQLLLQTFRLLCQSDSNKGLYQSRCAYLFHLFKENIGDPLSTNDWLKLGDSDLKYIAEFLPEEISNKSHQLVQLPLTELIEKIIAIYHLNENEEILPYLFAFRDCLAQFIDSGNAGLAEFLDWWDTQPEISLPSAEENTQVQILTVHKSKGLAFDVVILPFLFWPFDGNPRNQVWVNVGNTPFEQLQSAPLKYGKSFSGSVLKNQYFEEQLYCYIDALNTLYVAMTRPRKHLFLCLPGYSKKSPNSVIAGDALLAALEQYKHTHQKELVFPENQVKAESKLEPKVEKGDWYFKEYPMAHHLKKQLDNTTSDQLQRLDNDENIRTGIAVHELLSFCHKQSGVESALHKLAQEGWFSEKEKPGIQKIANSVLANKELQILLNRPGIFLDERDIIAKGGNVHRPDKVLVGQEETIIIDFKFTAKESQKHVEQVTLYKMLFTEMGYPGVKGYLFYGFQGMLQEV